MAWPEEQLASFSTDPRLLFSLSSTTLWKYSSFFESSDLPTKWSPSQHQLLSLINMIFCLFPLLLLPMCLLQTATASARCQEATPLGFVANSTHRSSQHEGGQLINNCIVTKRWSQPRYLHTLIRKHPPDSHLPRQRALKGYV